MEDRGSYISIANRGEIRFECDDSLFRIGEDKKIYAAEIKKELEQKWKFEPISRLDTALFDLGYFTPEFYLKGYDAGNKQIWGIAVYCRQNKIIGLYHTVLGQLKPVEDKDLCYYFISLTQ